MKHHLSNAIAKTQIKSNFQNYHQQNQSQNQKRKQREFQDQQQQHRIINLIHINNLLEHNFWFNFQVIIIIIIIIVSMSSATTVFPMMQSIASMESDQTTYPDVIAVVGSDVSLPCNVSRIRSDNVTLILWYRSDDMISGPPIYSVDARSTSSLDLSKAIHFTPESMSSRAKFDLTVRPAMLRIKEVNPQDDGQYWCRVDYRWTRTTISLIKLNVIVPPKSVKVFYNEKQINDTHVLLNENDNATFTCLSFGGKPVPQVKWFKNSQLIYQTTKQQEYLNESSNSNQLVVENKLVIENVPRNYLFVTLTCQSSNNNLTKPISTSFSIDMNLRPLTVQIDPPMNGHLTAGIKSQVVCHSVGARPPAKFHWFIGDPQRDLTDSGEWFKDGNFSQSILTFTPEWRDDNTQLTCQASNSLLKNGTIYETIKLDVRYAPVLILTSEKNTIKNKNNKIARNNSNANINRTSNNINRATNSVNSNRNIIKANTNDGVGGVKVKTSVNNLVVMESDEIHLNCGIKSNPNVSGVKWLFNGQEILTDPTQGIITSNSTLIIESAKRHHHGMFQCLAFNKLGEGTSNQIKISIEYTPVCISESKEFQLKFGESVNISCYVNAEPNDVTFFWSINNSIDDHSHQHSYLESHNQVGINENDNGDLLMESKIGIVKSSWIESVLNYKPKKFQDFSVINCWGQNKVGSQRFPCQFNVTMTPPPAPDSIESCSLNSTLTSINIDCFIHGHDQHKLNDNVDRENVDHGSHDSLFHLEVLDSRKSLLANMTSSSPNFLLENLNSGETFLLKISSSNFGGRSKELTLTGKTLTKIPTSKTYKSMIEVPLLYEFVIQSKDPLILFLIIICALLITSIVILLIIFKMKTIKSIKEIKKNYETELKQRNEHEQHEHEQNRSDNEESPDGQQQHYKMTMMTMDQNVMFTDINEPDLIPYDNENIIRIKAQQQNQLLNCSKLQNHIPNGNLLNGGLNYKLPIHSLQRGKNFNMNFISSSPSQSASTSSSITTGTTKASQLSGSTIQQQQQQSHVKFLSPDDTNWIIMNDGDEMAMKSFGATKPIGFMMPTTENNQHKIVVATIENHPYNQRFNSSSYSTPV